MAIERELVVPTPETVLRVANCNIMDNLRRRQDANVDLASLYRRAFMVVYNTGEFPVEYDKVEDT
jgi:hypothetical protein